MKRLIWLLLVASAFGQVNAKTYSAEGPPSSGTSQTIGDRYIDIKNAQEYTCTSTTYANKAYTCNWTNVGTGSLAAPGPIGSTTPSTGSFTNILNSSNNPNIVQSGLMAEYRILPTETPATLADYSGNGNNATGTVGTGQAIISGTGGVSFNGNGAISLPAALNAARTIQVFVSYQQWANGTQGSPVIGNTIPCIGPSFTTTATTLNGGNKMSMYSNAFTVNSYNRSAWMGQGLYTVVMPGTTDLFYVNGANADPSHWVQPNTNSAGLQTTGNYQLGGAAAGTCYANKTYINGNIYYAAFYNRALSDQEVAANAAVISSYLASRGIANTMPAGNPVPVLLGSGNTNNQNQFVAHGDSITNGSGATPYASIMTLSGFNIANLGQGGATSLQAPPEGPFDIDPYLANQAPENIDVVWLGTNDMVAGRSVNQVMGALRSYCQARRIVGWKCLIATMLSRGGQDANKNSLNASMRQHWAEFSDGLVDMAADPIMGADGANANATFFQGDLTHPNSTVDYNNILPIVQRAANRVIGNRDFSSATTYTTAAAAAVATTAGSESTNTATITFGATPANCQQGNTITIAGTTPAGYSGNWTILTRSSTQVTYFATTASMGAITVQGTGVCSQQQDSDVYTILGGSAAGNPAFTMESCVGYTGQNLYFKNTNTTSAWVLTPFTSSETIDGAATLTMPTASSGNNPVVILQAQLISAAAGGCTWKRLQ